MQIGLIGLGKMGAHRGVVGQDIFQMAPPGDGAAGCVLHQDMSGASPKKRGQSHGHGGAENQTARRIEIGAHLSGVDLKTCNHGRHLFDGATRQHANFR